MLKFSIVRYTKNLIKGILNAISVKNAQNIEAYRQGQALKETVAFIEENMSQTKSFFDKYSLLAHAVGVADREGLFLEFGVYKGDSINFMASKLDKILYGFDSFEGLPEYWRDGVEKGAFALGKMPRVRKNVTLIKGLFEESLPKFLKDTLGPCSFIHVDSDLYSSAQFALQMLGPRITQGTVIVFDEFFNYPGWKNGEYKAFMEFVNSSRVRFEYIGYCRYSEQVAVRVLETAPRS